MGFTGHFWGGAGDSHRQRQLLAASPGAELGSSVCHSALEALSLLNPVLKQPQTCDTAILCHSTRQKAGLESLYLQDPCAQQGPGACGEKQGLVSVFSCDFQ